MHQEHLPLLHLLRGHVLCVDDVVVIRDDQDHLLYGGHRRGCVEMYAWCYVMCNVTCTVTCITTKVRACVCMHIWYTMVYHACTLRARTECTTLCNALHRAHRVEMYVASCASSCDPGTTMTTSSIVMMEVHHLLRAGTLTRCYTLCSREVL